MKLIRKFGGKPYIAPTIELKPYQNKKKILKTLNKVFDTQIDYLIFKSVNAVSFFISYLHSLQQKENFLKKLKNACIIAIGPKTSAELKKNGIETTFVPKKFSSEGIIESLKGYNLLGKNIIIPCPKNNRNRLTKKLRDFGAKVLIIPIYESTLPKDQSKVFTLIKDLIKRKIDIITFTSSYSVLNLIKVASKHKLDVNLRDALNECLIVVIGPITLKTLENLGVKADIIPKDYIIEAMIDSLIKYLHQESKKIENQFSY